MQFASKQTVTGQTHCSLTGQSSHLPSSSLLEAKASVMSEDQPSEPVSLEAKRKGS